MNFLGLEHDWGLKDISNRLSDIFSRQQNRAVPNRGTTIFPDWALQVDISESDADYMVSGDIPGVDTKEVKISFHDGMLIVHGDRKLAGMETNRRFHRTECSHGRFERSFRMPEDTDEKTVKIEFRDGTFILTLPKVAKSIVGI